MQPLLVITEMYIRKLLKEDFGDMLTLQKNLTIVPHYSSIIFLINLLENKLLSQLKLKAKPQQLQNLFACIYKANRM